MNKAQKFLSDNNIPDPVLNANKYKENTKENSEKWIYLSDVLEQYITQTQKNESQNIRVKRKDNSLKRHFLKTISYRILGTLTTVIVALSLGMSIEVSSLLGVGELILKPIIYFLHERTWFKFAKLHDF